MVAPAMGCWPPWTLPLACELLMGLEPVFRAVLPQPVRRIARRVQRKRGTARRRTMGAPGKRKPGAIAHKGTAERREVPINM